MTKEEIEEFFILQHNIITYNSARVNFKDGSFKIGFFQDTIGDKAVLKEKNQWRFIEKSKVDLHGNDPKNLKYIAVLDGNTILNITPIGSQ